MTTGGKVAIVNREFWIVGGGIGGAIAGWLFRDVGFGQASDVAVLERASGGLLNYITDGTL